MRGVGENRSRAIFTGQGEAPTGAYGVADPAVSAEPRSESGDARSASIPARTGPAPSSATRRAANSRLPTIGERISYLLAARRANPSDDILKEWLHGADDGEQEGRQIAVARIKAIQPDDGASLDLKGLQLSSLPDCLRHCTNLVQLDASFNRLTSLPTLPSTLLKIDISNNQLNSLPEFSRRRIATDAYPSRLRRPPTIATSAGLLQHSDHHAMYARPLPAADFVETPEQSPIMCLDVSNNPWLLPALDQIDTLPRFISLIFRDRREARRKADDARNEHASLAPGPVAEMTDRNEIEPMEVDEPANSRSLLRTVPLTEAGHYRTAELRQLGFGIFRLNLIDELACKKAGPAATVAQQGQVRMEYQTMLATRLHLPGIVSPSFLQALVTVSKRDLDNAITHIAHREAGIDALDFLTTWKPWEREMRRHYPEAYRVIAEKLARDIAWLSPRPHTMSVQQHACAYDDQFRRETIETQACTMRCTLVSMAEKHLADLAE